MRYSIGFVEEIFTVFANNSKRMSPKGNHNRFLLFHIPNPHLLGQLEIENLAAEIDGEISVTPPG
jgi:hypothetical protein